MKRASIKNIELEFHGLVAEDSDGSDNSLQGTIWIEKKDGTKVSVSGDAVNNYLLYNLLNKEILRGHNLSVQVEHDLMSTWKFESDEMTLDFLKNDEDKEVILWTYDVDNKSTELEKF